MNTALTCIGLLGLLVFGLGVRVSLLRTSTNTLIGSSTDPADPLYKWMRAHGNACEFVPMLALLIYVAAMRGPSGFMKLVMVLAVLARYLHAAGMVASSSLDQPQNLRFAGALGTYITGLLLSLSVLFG